MKLLVISENANYMAGGAELSMLNEVLNINNKLTSCKVISLENKNHQRIHYNSEKCHQVFLKPLAPILKKASSIFFVQINIIYHLRYLKTCIHEYDLIYTQNRFSPYIAFLNNFFHLKKDISIFIRDEKCIGIYRCYGNLIYSFFWYIKKFFEMPFILIHKGLIKEAFKDSKIIFNSNFMLTESVKMGLKSKSFFIKHPEIGIIKKDEIIKFIESHEGIYKELYDNRFDNTVLIGNEYVKGINIYKKIARNFRNKKFIIFGKNIKQPHYKENLIFLPWSEVSGLPYMLANVVCVPSIWKEAYGRVVAESKQFDNHILIFNKGGLPEALGNYSKGHICNNIDDFRSNLKEIWKM